MVEISSVKSIITNKVTGNYRDYGEYGVNR